MGEEYGLYADPWPAGGRAQASLRVRGVARRRAGGEFSVLHRHRPSRKRNRSGTIDLVVFDEVEVTTSGQFKELYPGRVLPQWLWMKVDGKPGVQDFGIGMGVRLIVSERALDLLKRVGFSNAASIRPLNP
jgi:hypothetical protein